MRFQDWILDKRVINRNVRRGIIPRAEYQKYLGGLKDVSDNVAHDDPGFPEGVARGGRAISSSPPPPLAASEDALPESDIEEEEDEEEEEGGE